MLSWMAWTWPTAIFFCCIGAALVVFILLAIYWPETPRVGILGFPTTRGDRFFVTMLGAAYIVILWMHFDGGSLWYPLAISVLFGIGAFVLT